MSNKPSSPIHIAIVAFSGMSLFHLSVPLTVFAEDRQRLGIPPFKVTVCATDDKVIDTSNGLKLIATAGLECLTYADVVIIPTWHYDLRAVPQHLIAAIQKAHKQGKLLVGLCLGSFVFAASGLLTDKVIATHWGWVELFKQRYPDININPDVLYIDEGQIITSAGMAAALDCCLYLLKRLCGAQVANKVAKQLVTAPHRQGGQVQFIEQALPTNITSDRLASLLSWLQENLAKNHTINQLAKHAAMSRRSFTRHFKQLTGYSLTQWLIEQRISHAQSLLETSSFSLEQIALQVGFSSSKVLRQHFLKKFKISPSQYQKNFNDQ